MPTRTKIICTIGPAVSSLEMMIKLMEAGMDVARLNFSHGTHEEHEQVIFNLKQARRRMGRPLAIMLDTKGPEIRLGRLQGGEITLRTGQKWLLSKASLEGNTEQVSIIPGSVLDSIPVDTRILFDDGYISSRVLEVCDQGLLVEIENGGKIRSGKGVNVPNGATNLPAITAKDVEDIKFGCLHDIDIIAASFVRSADHVLEIKRLLHAEGKSDIQVMAKIENREGVQNIDSIVQVADGIMIARGDLGCEVHFSQVPALQKMMIRKCYLAGKPSITATQMLESMINNPRPTRAEASDVANAIYDSTSAVMLSGETAVGKFPLETVRAMKQIVLEAEMDFDYQIFFDYHSSIVYHDVPSALTLAAVKTAYSSHAKAIFAFTSSGSTARLLSRLRPQMPIIAMTDNEKSYNQMACNWGVTPFLSSYSETVDEAFAKVTAYALENQHVSYGDLVVVTAGTPFGVSGTTNMMVVESIGDVLVRGHVGTGSRVYGKVALVLTADSVKPYSIRGQILVLAQCDDAFLPLIREAAGVILQNHINDELSEKNLLEIGKALDKPVVVRADGAYRVLKEGQLVTLDPEKALIYKGVVL